MINCENMYQSFQIVGPSIFRVIPNHCINLSGVPTTALVFHVLFLKYSELNCHSLHFIIFISMLIGQEDNNYSIYFILHYNEHDG
jgi:hypothetical protein